MQEQEEGGAGWRRRQHRKEGGECLIRIQRCAENITHAGDKVPRLEKAELLISCAVRVASKRGKNAYLETL